MITTDRNSKNFSYLTQIGIFIGLIGAGMIIGGFISVAIWILMTGRPFMAMADDMLKPQYYTVAMTLQVVSTFFLFFLPTYIFSLICYRKQNKFLGFNKNINMQQFFIVLAILVLTFPLSGALAELNKIIPISKHWADYFRSKEDARAAEEAALISINTFPRYIFSLIVVGLLPGLFEEVIFRAGLQNILTRWLKGPWIAIIFTSILFSLVHISYYGFLVRFALGIILGLIFYESGNLWLSAFFHFLYNGLQVTALYAYSLSPSKDQKDIEQSFPLWVGVVAAAFIVLLFIRFNKISLLQKAKVANDNIDDDLDFENWTTAQT